MQDISVSNEEYWRNAVHTQWTLLLMRTKYKQLAYLVIYPSVCVCVCELRCTFCFARIGFPVAHRTCVVVVVRAVRLRPTFNAECKSTIICHDAFLRTVTTLTTRVLSERASWRCRQQKERSVFVPLARCINNTGMGVSS
jgi:hypothetical protein